MSRVDLPTLGYVIVGGAFGVLARAALLDPVVDTALVPWATLAINAVGSFLLGVVVGAFGDGRPHVRAFLGTGVLGGFTTYSAFAVEAAVGLVTPVPAVALVAASLTAGVVGAVAGLAVGRLGARARPGAMDPEVAE